MSDHVDTTESMDDRPALVRRPRVSILELMLLVAALGVSFRWPGLSVPVGLLFLCVLAQRRGIVRRQTRGALGQIALAMYLPPAVRLLLVLREEWGYYLEHFSLMPNYFPWACFVLNLPWFFRFNPPLFPSSDGHPLDDRTPRRDRGAGRGATARHETIEESRPWNP